MRLVPHVPEPQPQRHDTPGACGSLDSRRFILDPSWPAGRQHGRPQELTLVYKLQNGRVKPSCASKAFETHDFWCPEAMCCAIRQSWRRFANCRLEMPFCPDPIEQKQFQKHRELRLESPGAAKRVWIKAFQATYRSELCTSPQDSGLLSEFSQPPRPSRLSESHPRWTWNHIEVPRAKMAQGAPRLRLHPPEGATIGARLSSFPLRGWWGSAHGHRRPPHGRQ